MKFITVKLSLIHTLLLLVIFLLAAGLRWWGIDFGLPFLYHPDEPNKIELAQTFLRTRDINPHYFLKPPFYIYLNAAAYLPYIMVNNLIGNPIGPWTLEPPFMLAMGTGYTSQPETALLGRSVSLLFGSLTVLVVYFLTLKVFHNRLAATLAALFVAVSPGMIPHSRYITPDTLVVFFCVLSAYIAINIYQSGRMGDYLLAGICGALAASAKYNAALVLLLPATAHLLRNGLLGSFRDRKILIGVIAAPITFILLNPIVLFEFQEFYQGASYEAAHYAQGHQGMEGNSLTWYINYFWRIEGLTALLGLLGILLAFIQRNKKSILLAAFPIIFFIFISSFLVRNDRTAIPITPFLYIFTAVLLATLIQNRLEERWKHHLLGYSSAALTVFLLVFSLASSVQSTQRMMTIDSRETSRIWIETSLPPGSAIAIESYAPYVDPRRFRVSSFGRIIDNDPTWYKENEFDYIVVSQGMFMRFFNEPERYGEQIEQYNQLFAAFEPLKIFKDGNFEVRVYRVP